MIPFDNRFHGHSSLNYVYRNGQAIHSHSFIVKTVNNPKRQESRAAVIVSKKVLKGAVKRNRVRRQIYGYILNILPNLNGVYDIAIIVTSGEVFTASHSDIYAQLDQVFNQTNIKKVTKLL
jgi:ribonuclease P protein component